MRKLVVLMLVLGMASLASATTISLNGAGSTISGLVIGQTVQILINTDAKLLGLDATVHATGGSLITGAMSSADAATYGWDAAGFPIDPVGVGTALVELAAANFNGAPATVPGPVGYVSVKYMGGTAIVSIANAVDLAGGSLNVDGVTVPSFDQRTLTLTPEPATLAILGLGGLLLRRKK